MLLRGSSRTPGLLVLEALLMCACGVTAIYIRFGGQRGEAVLLRQGWAKVLLMATVVEAAFYVCDLYDLDRVRRKAVLVLGVLQALGMASMVLSLIFYCEPRVILGRGTLIIGLCLMLITMLAWRVSVMWLIRHPRFAERILILGTDEAAISLAREILKRQEFGFKIVGFVGDEPALIGKSLINPKVIGLIGQLEDVVSQFRADRVVIATADRRKKLPLIPLMSLGLRGEVAIEESASFYERLTGKISTETLRPSWLIFSGKADRARLYRRIFRILELPLTGLILLLAAPLMLLVALAIKLDSKGGVLYVQERVGQHNKEFRIIKFRSMSVDAEKNGVVWAAEVDPRVTRIGKLIRKTRIDELPQLINVIRGEMSLIGPRPERRVFVNELERHIPFYCQRHLVKPGITGWAQVRYRYGASLEDAREKLKYDLYYIKNQSPLLDALIVFETARIVTFGRGAR
jgi:sugar transferase (PEP-CTERM system associated)